MAFCWRCGDAAMPGCPRPLTLAPAPRPWRTMLPAWRKGGRMRSVAWNTACQRRRSWVSMLA
eukprot:7034891-Pyramimonas_sp.AAC.1